MALSQHETEILHQLERQFTGPERRLAFKWPPAGAAAATIIGIVFAGAALALLALVAGPGICVAGGAVLGILLGQVLATSDWAHHLRRQHWQKRIARKGQTQCRR